MESKKIIDARGFSCPEPVILTKRALNSLAEEELKVLVGDAAAKENVSRLARNSGYNVKIEEIDSDYQLIIKKR
ncbi:sulfurtransferase TusA family protein [Fuchsiella alkaliacetigena]|uniref:sulfurtransferase TusA family protein n=1 Tax=Fuchsiella alkaliacetigena TaxID=957042 RepID=UPI00200B5EB9|nr:sulfurtransferase TusA family protein [Fuchsiella alkaliacetigena]MCK8826103.1 sulfurtransferase TusA family protein [Fuchsiella alkaliacetigena]